MKQPLRLLNEIPYCDNSDEDSPSTFEDNNSQLNSTSCSSPNYNFKYEWDGKLYHSDEYFQLIHQFRSEVRNIDSVEDIVAQISLRLEQVNHLTYLRTCFQRMADNTVGSCRSELFGICFHSLSFVFSFRLSVSSTVVPVFVFHPCLCHRRTRKVE